MDRPCLRPRLPGLQALPPRCFRGAPAMREIFRSLRNRVKTFQALRHKRRRVVPKGSQKAVVRRHPRAYTDGGMAVQNSHSLLSSFKHMRIFQHMIIFRHLSSLYPEAAHAFRKRRFSGGTFSSNICVVSSSICAGTSHCFLPVCTCQGLGPLV